jgi:hypothetical protein
LRPTLQRRIKNSRCRKAEACSSGFSHHGSGSGRRAGLHRNGNGQQHQPPLELERPGQAAGILCFFLERGNAHAPQSPNPTNTRPSCSPLLVAAGSWGGDIRRDGGCLRRPSCQLLSMAVATRRSVIGSWFWGVNGDGDEEGRVGDGGETARAYWKYSPWKHENRFKTILRSLYFLKKWFMFIIHPLVYFVAKVANSFCKHSYEHNFRSMCTRIRMSIHFWTKKL